MGWRARGERDGRMIGKIRQIPIPIPILSPFHIKTLRIPVSLLDPSRLLPPLFLPVPSLSQSLAFFGFFFFRKIISLSLVCVNTYIW